MSAKLNKALKQGEKATGIFSRVISELEKAEQALFDAEVQAAAAAADATAKATVAREARERHISTLEKVRELVG